MLEVQRLKGKNASYGSLFCNIAVVACALMPNARVQQANGVIRLPSIIVDAPEIREPHAGQANLYTDKADLGPLGQRSILDTPASVTTVPEDLTTNLQAQGVDDVLRYLP